MKRLFFLTAIVVLTGLPALSQTYGIVMDQKTSAQVARNSVSKIAKESLTQNYVEKGEENQRTIRNNVLAIQTALEVYRRTYENVSSFGNDSKNIIEIGKLSKAIAEEIGKTSKEIRKNPKATIASHRALYILTEETAQCLKTCYSLVTKSTVKFPTESTGKVENDGINWLSPTDRLNVAYGLITRLRIIHNTLVNIRYQQQYSNTWTKVFQEAAPYDWHRIMRNKETAEEIINAFSK